MVSVSWSAAARVASGDRSENDETAHDHLFGGWSPIRIRPLLNISMSSEPTSAPGRPGAAGQPRAADDHGRDHGEQVGLAEV